MSSMMVLMTVSKLLLSTLSSSILTSRSILMLILVVMVVIIDPFNFLAAIAARSPSGEYRLRVLLHHTRRGLNRQRNLITPLFTNQDLISCLHLLVNDTLSDKEFLLNSSTKADIYIISERSGQ